MRQPIIDSDSLGGEPLLTLLRNTNLENLLALQQLELAEFGKRNLFCYSHADRFMVSVDLMSKDMTLVPNVITMRPLAL